MRTHPNCAKVLILRATSTYKQEVAGSSPALPTIYPTAHKMAKSGSFDQARNPYQNHRAHKRHNDGADHAAAGPDSQHPEYPAANKPTHDAEKDVHDHAVAAALHHLPSQPTCNQSNHNPCDKSHVAPPERFS